MIRVGEADYGRLVQKVSVLISQRGERYLEKVAKLLLVAKLLRLEGLAHMLEVVVKRVGSHERELPAYLLPIFQRDGGYDGWLEAGWHMLAKKIYCRDLSFLDKLRLWWIYGELSDSDSMEAKLLLGLLRTSSLPEGWRLTEVEQALCL